MDGIRPPHEGGNNSDKKGFSDPGRIGRLKDQMYSRYAQPAQRPRRPLSDNRQNIPEDWVEETPEEHKQTPLQSPQSPRSYSLPNLFLIVAVLIFVVAGSVAAYFLMSGSNIVASRKIDIVINGPRTVDGGEVLELQVAVQNNNNATLELADLVVTYPEGTRMPADLTTAMETQRIPLGSIEPGGTRNGTIRGVMFGREGARQEITVALEYRLAGSSALFYAEATHSVLVTSGSLEIALTTNREAVAGQSLDMTATVTSYAKTTLNNVVLRATYPFGFTVKSVTPEAETEGLWNLGDIQPGESKTVRILGVLDGQTGDTRVFRFIAGTRENTDSKMVDVVLAEFEHEVEVTRPFLTMSLQYEDKPANSYVGRIGDTIPITLTWRNNLDVALTDVVIAAHISGTGFDPFNISADRGFFRSSDSLVLWDKTTTQGALELIPAGEEGTLSIRLTPGIADNLFSVQDPTINIELHAAGKRLSEGSVPETIQATVSEEIKITTDVSLSGQALYFENPLGSVGPLPPKVEHETTYGILWELTNTTSLVRDAKVTAVLPPYVRWIGTVSPSVENVTFNENTAVLTWHVGKLLPSTGVDGTNPRRVAFSIGLVPSTSQIGQTPPLIQNQKLTGIDNFVEQPVEFTFDDLTTQLNEVDFADIYGVIVQ